MLHCTRWITYKILDPKTQCTLHTIHDYSHLEGFDAHNAIQGTRSGCTHEGSLAMIPRRYKLQPLIITTRLIGNRSRLYTYPQRGSSGPGGSSHQFLPPPRSRPQRPGHQDLQSCLTFSLLWQHNPKTSNSENQAQTTSQL